MSDARRLRPVVRPEPDIRQIIQEAQTRWLKPLEVCEILRNYQAYNFKLNPVPPNRPPGGSLFLFDRKALRYFRKDGHNWRKKKDGKTVREAHERLKAGCVDVLHCYYAHGEENPNFQRRSYWMLEGAYEHIVLVHYLEVSQANRFRPSRDHSTDGATRQEALVANSISQPNAAYPSPTASELEVNGPMSSDVTGSTMSSEVEDVDSDGEIYDLEHENGPLVEQGVDYKDISTDWSSLLTSMSYSNQQLPLNVQSSQLLSNREPHQTVSSSEMDLADLLKNPDLLGPKPISSAVTLDLSGWNQLLGSTGPNKVVPKEEINYSSWEEILQQCTTPSTSQEILRSIQIKQEEAWSPMNVNDINATTSMSPKGLIDALSPRGLGREPQTVLEKYLRDATEENALKAAAEAHRRWTPQQTSQTQQIDIQRPSQKMGTQEMSSQQGWMSFSKQPMQNGEQLYPSGLNGWNYSLQQPKDQNKLEMGQQMVWQGKKIIHTEQQHAKDLNVTDHEEPLKDFKSNMSFKKVDSFNQWFMNEIGNDEPISRQADSGSLWMTSLEDEGAVEEISSQLQLEMGLNTSISQVQRFTISDFSPDWGFSSSEVKVLVTGKFLDTVRSPSDFSWCCMFGEVEVPAELVNDNVLRCKAPPHAPGRVPFYVTCSNRLACSEVREFEYRLKPETSDLRNLENGTSQSEQELLVQISLTQMLLGNGDVSGSRTYSSSISNEELIGLKSLVENHRIQPIEMKEKLLQVFLKDKLKNWLMGKDGQAISILNENGQGILHMVAAVGYDWAIPSILKSGLVVNFRDSHGWTALHWAAAFGREKTILALLAAGAGAGLVTDPTPKYPSGQTPADLASQSGHKGISGFLAEKALAAHLSALTIREGNVNELSTISAAMQADHAMNAIRNNVAVWGTEEQLALQRSLSAVRNATQAAALIHAAFRQVSFREKNLIPEELDLGLLYEEMQAINAANKIQKAYRGHRQKLHLAAVQIQRKFRGWVRRKEFLKLRKHVVRIQAHVRGHQVRKKYRKILWSVGILEKAVLRWRRKRVGLRGFHLQNSAMETTEEVVNSDDDDFLKEGRKQKEAAFEKAVTRVHSMARSDVARAQYRRLREDFPLIERQLKSRMGGQDGAL